jgi:hypothetical protein
MHAWTGELRRTLAPLACPRLVSLEVRSRFPLDQAMVPPPAMARSAEPPPIPDDADLARWFDHGLWGSSREVAWSDGRLYGWSEERERRWQTAPARVAEAIEALRAERFWELTTSGMPVPDELRWSLRARTAEGLREVSLWAHDWRSGRAARCKALVDQLFASPAGE